MTSNQGWRREEKEQWLNQIVLPNIDLNFPTWIRNSSDPDDCGRRSQNLLVPVNDLDLVIGLDHVF